MRGWDRPIESMVGWLSMPRNSLTVAVPTCNGGAHLAEALRGIRAQEGVAFDLLICDDRSDDDTLAVVRAEAGDRVRVVVNPQRLGLAGNWNRCAALCRTPLVTIFHQDDLMHPGHLAAHATALLADDSLGMACSAAGVVDSAGCEVPATVVGRGNLGPTDRVFAAGAFVAELAAGNPVRCSAVTLRASALAEVGGFDPGLRYVVDWDCWLRIARLRGVAWLAKPTVSVRWHAASETHRFKGGIADIDETAALLDDLYRRVDPSLPDARHLRRRADRMLSRAFLNRAYDAACAGDRRLSLSCLRRAFAAWPGIVGTIAADPRLLGRLMVGAR